MSVEPSCPCFTTTMFPVLPGFPVSYPPIPLYGGQLAPALLNNLARGQTRAYGAASQTEPSIEIDLPSTYMKADILQELSEYSSKLGGNYVPTDQEVKHLKELLVEPFANLQALDADIASTQALLSKNIKDRTILVAQLTKYRSLVSPIRRIPPDVLSEIFFHCLPTDAYTGSMSVVVAPMLLTRVCSAWRTTAYPSTMVHNSNTFTPPCSSVYDLSLVGPCQ
ncbi:hypothetical protein CPB83DRAFT_201199 [Crepidotus variabilis]|uniref:F-box domain-containing protein n=1 Tax=Crepidotus variabilis TaxID=179855 RepID=A0A9P6EJB9_9AGAR|nr:hypothetical protein CPB83DRAFT_201199 [Crepidotus variabilis]